MLLAISHEITRDENEKLLRPISEQEINEAIWTMHLDKAPGPNEFTINFYRAAWDIIKEDL